MAGTFAPLGIKSVQRGTMNGSIAGTTQAVSSVDTTKSSLMFTGNVYSAGPAYLVLTNSTTITAYRYTDMGYSTVYWQLVEYY